MSIWPFGQNYRDVPSKGKTGTDTDVSPQISQSSLSVTRADQTGVPFCGVLMRRLLDRKGNFVGILQGQTTISAN